MRLLYPLAIIKTGEAIKLLAAVAVVADGTRVEVFKRVGFDDCVSIQHAARIMGELIDTLMTVEVDVPDQMQVEAFKVCGQPEKWRTV